MTPTGRPVHHIPSVIRSRWLLAAVGFLVIALTPSVQGQVFKTQQTQCWNSAGALIACAGTGQDGELQKGVTQNYTDNGDGTVTDNLTGLMWEKLDALNFVANPSDIHDADNPIATWAAAFAKIATLNSTSFAGYSDWRLPNVNELESIAIAGRFVPAADPVFVTRSTGNYWSSTTELGLPSNAWGGQFHNGGPNHRS